MHAAGIFGVVLAAVVTATAQAAPAAEQALTLAEAVDLALRNHPALVAAEGRESGAWSAADRAAAERWPQLRLESRLGHVSEVPQSLIPGMAPVPLAEQDTWVTTATLQQLVYAGGRVTALVRQADRVAAAARAARLRTRQVAAFNAERSFLTLLATQEEIGVAARSLAAAEDHLRVAADRLAARVAARFDVLHAEVQVEEARQEVIRADGNVQVAHAQLLLALGLGTGNYRALAPPAVVDARLEVEGLLAVADRQRPDLQSLIGLVAAAEAGLAVARAERYPTLGLAADYQLVTPESATVFSRWSVGALASLPLLDGGRAAARRGEAEAALVQARAALDAGRRQVESEVRLAVARVTAAAAQMRVAARRIEQAEELSRLADVRFAAGVGTATEVADAQASLARARYGATRAGAERGIAAAELKLAVGSSSTSSGVEQTDLTTAPAGVGLPDATKGGEAQ